MSSGTATGDWVWFLPSVVSPGRVATHDLSVATYDSDCEHTHEMAWREKELHAASNFGVSLRESRSRISCPILVKSPATCETQRFLPCCDSPSSHSVVRHISSSKSRHPECYSRYSSRGVRELCRKGKTHEVSTTALLPDRRSRRRLVAVGSHRLR